VPSGVAREEGGREGERRGQREIEMKII
jgi:hypothetical protein